MGGGGVPRSVRKWGGGGVHIWQPNAPHVVFGTFPKHSEHELYRTSDVFCTVVGGLVKVW